MVISNVVVEDVYLSIFPMFTPDMHGPLLAQQFTQKNVEFYFTKWVRLWLDGAWTRLEIGKQ